MNAHAPARPAQFDASDQRRRALLGKVHIAKKELGLDDRAYQQALFDATGYLSAADCSEAQLTAALDAFKAMGFKAKPASRPAGGAKPATHKGAAKARALWISLHQLGAIDNPSELALEAFAKAQLGCDRLQFANQSHLAPLIEALKGMAERHGWPQDLTGVPAHARVTALQRRLIEAIFAKLRDGGAVPEDWTVERAARVFGAGDIEWLGSASSGQLSLVAQVLGAKRRELLG